jgi:small subunit ribosomal protein S4
MAKSSGSCSVCSMCRREGDKLFLKGERCFTPKCAMERRPFGPGQHGKGRQQFSQYKIQLREKQKVKRMFGLREKQFRGYFDRALKRTGPTGTELLVLLESRLDNTVYRLGFSPSRTKAKQLVSHGHVLVNGKRVNIGSYEVSVGDTIEVVDSMKKNVEVQAAVAAAKGRMIAPWLSLDEGAMKGACNAAPTREQMYQNVKEQLIVELYSRF